MLEYVIRNEVAFSPIWGELRGRLVAWAAGLSVQSRRRDQGSAVATDRRGAERGTRENMNSGVMHVTKRSCTSGSRFVRAVLLVLFAGVLLPVAGSVASAAAGGDTGGMAANDG